MNQSRLKPRGSLVLVQFDTPTERRTASGVIIPPSKNLGKNPTARYEEGTVAEVGPGSWLECGKQAYTEDLRPGQRVIVRSGVNLQLGDSENNYFGVEVDGKSYGFVNQQDIIAILPDAFSNTRSLQGVSNAQSN